MKDFRYIIAVLTVMASFGCVSRNSPTQGAQNNPMPAIWRSITDRIDALEASHANRAEWTKNAAGSHLINSLADLHSVASLHGLKPSEQPALDIYFGKARHTVEFWWEEQFEVLVFFDSEDRPIHVVKFG